MRLLHGQSGESLISGLYMMFVLAIVLFVAVEVVSYGMSAWKLYSAAGEIMEMMKSQNGLDGVMVQRFRELTALLRLEDLHPRLEGTPKTVQRGDLLELRVEGVYKIHSLKPFGQELSIAMRLRLYGLAHLYQRSI